MKVIKKSQVGGPRGNKMSETFDESSNNSSDSGRRDAEGINRTKSLKFRQYMRQHVLQKYHKRRKEQFSSADRSVQPQLLSKDRSTKELPQVLDGELQKEIRNPNL